jgi:dTDP-4-amino-4,6-dideoxygalactose transaminase
MDLKKISFMDLKSQNGYVREELLQHFIEVLDSGSYVSGKFVSQFESSFAAAHDAKFAVACNSGTSAIEIILKSLGLGPGDEVIIPAMTFVATMEAVVATGATPVLVDVDDLTWNLSAENVRRGVTSRTKAVIFVHLHGSSAGIREVAEVAKEYGLHLIEDAAQAHLARCEGVSVGNFGIAAGFSFYPGKNLGALGEGGAIVTNSKDLEDSARLIRNWGAKQKYTHLVRGSNFRMDEIQAGFLEIKLKHLHGWTLKRQEMAEIYDSFFDSMGIQRPNHNGIFHSYHIYAIKISNRDEIATKLNERGIDTGIHYPHSLSTMEPWKKYFQVGQEPIVSTALSKGFLSLPLHESLSSEEIRYILETLREILN